MLDAIVNPTTKTFLKRNGLKPEMKILDIGCGSGIMTNYLAGAVGPKGKVVAIDNSKAQLEYARKNCTSVLDDVKLFLRPSCNINI